MRQVRLPLPEYSNSQIKELIKEYIHDEDDRTMLFLRLVNGKTFEAIAGIMCLDTKTARKRIHKGEEVLFRHLPG
jgi:DNA-directed RNA polymerase specialized sigma24 family protein